MNCLSQPAPSYPETTTPIRLNERSAMSRNQLDQRLDLAAKRITDLMEIQRGTLATQSKREAS